MEQGSMATSSDSCKFTMCCTHLSTVPLSPLIHSRNPSPSGMGSTNVREARRAAEDAEVLTEDVDPDSDGLVVAGTYGHELFAAG